VLAALPISQHLGIIALFLAVFYALLTEKLGAGEVGWTCVVVGLLSYLIRRLGWGSSSSPQTQTGSLRFWRGLTNSYSVHTAPTSSLTALTSLAPIAGLGYAHERDNF
jgi:hypothetical protein